jgi:hypothetical protein
MAVLLREAHVLANSILSNSPGNRHPSTFNYGRDISHSQKRQEFSGY